jgi:hypothetical protein
MVQSIIEDPRNLLSLASLTEGESVALAGVCDAASSLLTRFRSSNRETTANGAAPPGSVVSLSANAAPTGGDKTLAITGVMSLLVVAGAVTAVGAVSLVALSHREPDRTS